MSLATVTQQPIPVTETFIGRAYMTAGTVTVPFKRITQDSIVIATSNDPTATGAIRAVPTAGVGFVLTSLVGFADNGYIGYMVIIPPPES